MTTLTFAALVVGLLVSAAALLMALMWWLLDCPERLRGPITAGVFSLGFVLGVSGFVARYEITTPRLSDVRIFANAVHSTLQLVALSLDAGATPGLRLGLARILLPLATAQIIVAAVLSRARQSLLRMRLAFGIGGPDVIFLGCNDNGLRIANLYERLLDPAGSRRRRASRTMRGRILGVDSNLEAPAARAFQERYWLYEVPLDPEDAPAMLRLQRRRGVVVSTGDERTDVALVTQVVTSQVLAHPTEAGGAARRTKAPAVVVAIEDDTVPRACQLDPVLSSAYAKGTLQFIFPGRLDARQLFRAHAPHALSPGRFLARERNRCHVVLFTSAASLDSLASQAVRALVYDPAVPLRLTVCVEDVDAASRSLFSRFPAFTQAPEAWADPAYGAQLPLVRIEFVGARPERLDASLFRQKHTLAPMDAVYVVGRHDAETCLMAAEAFKVVATLAAPRPGIVVCLKDVDAHAHPPDAALGLTVQFFRLGAWADSDAATAELAALLPESARRGAGPDEIAERLWRSYGADPNAETWESTSHHVKWWNRFAADHAAIKLAVLRLADAATEGELLPLLADSGTRDWLARLEHRRYVCERMTDGWLSYAGPKANAYLLNPTLVPFDALPGDEAAKDARVVDDLKRVLRA